jgi:hypothetical protein
MPHPNLKLEDYPLLTIHNCLFITFTATISEGLHLHLYPEDML